MLSSRRRRASRTARSSIGRDASTPTTRPVVADGAGEVAGEVARPAGDVEHAVAGSEAEQQARDPVLVGHPGPEDALRDAPERRAPPALVDPSDRARAASAPDAGPAESRSAPQHVEVAVAPVAPSWRSRHAERQQRSTRVRSQPRRVSAPRLARAEARQRQLVLLHDARGLALAGDPLEPRDRALALDAGGIAGRQAPISRAIRSRSWSAKCGVAGADQLADVLDRDPVIRARAGPVARRRSLLRLLEPLTRTISVSSSIRACTPTLIADSSPMSQA